MRADLAVVGNVADGEGEDFGDAEAQEHLGRDEGAIARSETTDVSEEDPLFVGGEWTSAGETGAVAGFGWGHGAVARATAPSRTLLSGGRAFARALAQASTPSRSALRREGGGEALPWRVCYPAIKGGTPPRDTNHDGMPDDWERRHGLDPTNPDDRNGDPDGDGYTNLEAYLNSLIAPL